MKRILLLLIILLIQTDICYASFPVIDTSDIQLDSLQKEEIIQHHSNLQSLSIDLESCKCISCRNELNPILSKPNSLLNSESIDRSNDKVSYSLAIISFSISSIWFISLMSTRYKCLNNRLDCKDNNIMLQLCFISLLVAISIGIAAKTYFSQLRRKRD